MSSSGICPEDNQKVGKDTFPKAPRLLVSVAKKSRRNIKVHRQVWVEQVTAPPAHVPFNALQREEHRDTPSCAGTKDTGADGLTPPPPPFPALASIAAAGTSRERTWGTHPAFTFL